MGDTDLSIETIDNYIAKKILYRGLVLGCSRCADVSWFAIGDVTDCFTCRRCGLNQQYAFGNWKHSPEPAWFYKLDEMVYQMLAHDGDVTIRTLDVLRNASKRSFIYAPELALVPAGQSKPEMEIDICCILDGQALIGESKSVSTLKDKGVSPLQAATRYRELAGKINASGVVFSTFAESWNDVTSKAIDSTFSDYPHLKVVKLAREQL